MDKFSRRSFFKIAGAAAATATAPTHAARKGSVAASTAYTFFNADEARFIEAAVDRLIPADENGPGASDAGVPNFLDKQLGGAWGAGERLYRGGPWHEGAVTQGYQLPFTPGELFHHALRGIREDVAKRGGPPFERLAAKEQDAYLKQLEAGGIDLHGVPSKVFFESLLSLTVEGFFSDPVYGGNKDMAAWKMIGFPGAYASYYDLVDQHGIAFDREPISMADSRAHLTHKGPNIPAHNEIRRK